MYNILIPFRTKKLVKAEGAMRTSSSAVFFKVIKAALTVLLLMIVDSKCISCKENFQIVQSRAETVLPRPFSADFTNYNSRDKRQNYPKSIQDVLKENSSNNMERIGERNGTLKVDESGLQQFKPRDPSEVNLLATTSFRFSPTVEKVGKARTHSGRQGESKFNIIEMIRQKKPFVMTVSVIPVENEKEVLFFDNMWKMKTENQKQF